MIPESTLSPAPAPAVSPDMTSKPARFGQWRLRLSAALLALLLFAVTFGAWLWPQDPAVQWLSAVNQGPSLGREVAWVDHSREPAWQPTPFAGEADIVVIEASTERVALQWRRDGAAQLYRISRRPAGDGELTGWMPLGTTQVPRFVDRLQLDTTVFEYRVQSMNDDRRETGVMQLTVQPQRAISLFEARLNGLIDAEQSPAPQARLTLPAHPLGTDALGRDLLARLLQGGQSSLLVGVSAPLLCMILGALWGGIAALAGGRVDDWMMRVADFVIALPFLLFMILFRIAMGVGPGESGLLPMVLAMVLLGWPGPARLVRGQVLSLRTQPFVEAATLAGANKLWLLRVHLLPNVLPLLLVALSFAIPQAIFTEAFLSFIGMGVVAPTASWGSLCNEGVKTMLTEPAQLLWPALLISITVLAFNLLGDSLRDRMGLATRD